VTEAEKERQRVYWVWGAMMSRCRNPKSPQFRDYGGRGIKVCDRWKSSANFIADMGKRPTPKHTLERKDNNIGYGPDNCSWVGRSKQAKNKRLYRINRWGVAGVWAVRDRWRARIGVDGKKIHLGYFATLEDAAAARKAALIEHGFAATHGEAS
jgi:hypothetical protein